MSCTPSLSRLRILSSHILIWVLVGTSTLKCTCCIQPAPVITTVLTVAQVTDAIAECKDAGIRVIMITGDNKLTAEAVARDIGIFGPQTDVSGRSITGVRSRLRTAILLSPFSETCFNSPTARVNPSICAAVCSKAWGPHFVDK